MVDRDSSGPDLGVPHRRLPGRTTRAHALYRPEAMLGKMYARVPQAPAYSNVRVWPAIGLAVTCLLLLAVCLAFLPVTTSFRGIGWLAPQEGSIVVRSPRSGQVARVAELGANIGEGEPIARIIHVARPESGASLGGRARLNLSSLKKDQNEELRLIETKHALSRQQSDERERSLLRQAASLESAISNQRVLVEETARISQKMNSASQSGIVSKLDTVPLMERSTQATIRLIELERELANSREQLAAVKRSKEIDAIERVREERAVVRQAEDRELGLLRDATEDIFNIPSPRKGSVLVVTKQAGDWVEAGEQLAVVGGDAAAPHRIQLPVSAEVVNLIVLGQPAKVWANSQRKADAPLFGTVANVFQKSAAPDKQEGRPFVAEVVLKPGQTILGQGLMTVRTASQVDVEIILLKQSLIEALLPRRIGNGLTKIR